MRTVKSRGKRIDNGEWVEGSYLYDTDQDCHRIITKLFDIDAEKLDYQIGVEAHEVDPKTVGQYTGLLDKNGKEIYFGDILATSNDNSINTFGEIELIIKYW